MLSFLPSVTNKRGNATLITIIFLSVLLTLTGALTSHLMLAHSMSRRAHLRAKALHIAEGGLHKALWELSQNGTNYAGEKDTPLGAGAFTTEVSSYTGVPREITVTSTGYFFRPKSPRVRLRALVHLRTTGSGKSSVVVRHWEIASGSIPSQ